LKNITTMIEKELINYKEEPIVGQWQDYSDDDKLSDGEVLDLIYDFCEAQVMSHPILEKIITILKENE